MSGDIGHTGDTWTLVGKVHQRLGIACSPVQQNKFGKAQPDVESLKDRGVWSLGNEYDGGSIFKTALPAIMRSIRPGRPIMSRSGFLDVRPALWACGTGSAVFRNWNYIPKAID